MKLKLIFLGVYVIVLLISSILLKLSSKKQEKADMYLPPRLLAMGIAMLAASVAVLGYGVLIKSQLLPCLFAFFLMIMGYTALLCWKNQKIHIISEEEFTYTTFLGNTTTHRFEDILGLRKNKDSLTLFLTTGKVHMESMAVISNVLADKINAALESRLPKE